MTPARRTEAPGVFAHRTAWIAFACLIAFAAPARGASERWWSAGALAGSLQPDSRMADHQWSVTPRAAWGGQLRVGSGPWSAGARMWSAGTEQQLGLPDAESARVRSTRWEAVGGRRVACAWGAEVSAIASLGRLNLSWRPDHVAIDAPGGGAPIQVALRPVREWTAGAGLAVHRAVAPSWAAGLEIDHHVYRLDTTSRDGDGAERRRETFGDWSARVELAWRSAR